MILYIGTASRMTCTYPLKNKKETSSTLGHVENPHICFAAYVSKTVYHSSKRYVCSLLLCVGKKNIYLFGFLFHSCLERVSVNPIWILCQQVLQSASIRPGCCTIATLPLCRLLAQDKSWRLHAGDTCLQNLHCHW